MVNSLLVLLGASRVTGTSMLSFLISESHTVSVVALKALHRGLVVRIIALDLMLVTPILLRILQVVLLTAPQLATLAMATPPLPPVLHPAAVVVQETETILPATVPSLPVILDVPKL